MLYIQNAHHQLYHYYNKLLKQMYFIILIENTYLKNSTTENEVYNYIIDILQKHIYTICTF